MVQFPGSNVDCYTIGYGNLSPEVFLHLLAETGINVLVDVRSSPHSRHNYSFNRKILEQFLAGHDIGYVWLGDRIGGRYTSPDLLFPDGTVDFRKVRATEAFIEGIDRVMALIADGRKVVLMCAEKEPERCHRFSLISPVLQSKGIRVIHIRQEIRLQPNEELEDELTRSLVGPGQATLSGGSAVDAMYEILNRKMRYQRKK